VCSYWTAALHIRRHSPVYTDAFQSRRINCWHSGRAARLGIAAGLSREETYHCLNTFGVIARVPPHLDKVYISLCSRV
jgi:hypothetical protein